MAPRKGADDARLNRGTGLLVIEVRHSNPNGDPDAESEPRTLDGDGRGLISPVSYKRKLRDLVADKGGPAWIEAARILGLTVSESAREYEILETRGRERKQIWSMTSGQFRNRYWDARVFGSTFLEGKEANEAKQEREPKAKGKQREEGGTKLETVNKDHFINCGVVQFGPGISVTPIDVGRFTMTHKAGVEEDKKHGIAPLGWRVVHHAVYAMPFFVNPMMMGKTGCDEDDINLMKFLIPPAYPNTASAIRPFVEVRHAWYAEHKSPLGSCPDSLILDAMAPRKTSSPEKPSTSIDEYVIPQETDLPDSVRQRLASFEDLCAKQWQ